MMKLQLLVNLYIYKKLRGTDLDSVQNHVQGPFFQSIVRRIRMHYNADPDPDPGPPWAPFRSGSKGYKSNKNFFLKISMNNLKNQWQIIFKKSRNRRKSYLV